MRPIMALGFLLLGLNSAVPEPKHSNTVLAAADTPSAEPIAIDRLIGSIDVKTDVVVPSLEVLEASHEQQDSTADPLAGEAAPATTALDRDIASLDGLCNTLFDSAQHNDLPVPFFANLIWQESGLRHDAVSPVGAQGIAQFMPPTAAAVGLTNPFDPRQALPASARLLRELRDQFRNLGFAAAAYNAGAHRVSQWLLHGGKLPRETQHYVISITGRSVEEWRKSPPDDSAMHFARPLPCRQLPAFASLEQEQAQAQQELAQARQELGQALKEQAQAQKEQTQSQQVQPAAPVQPQQRLRAAVVERAPVARRRFATRSHVRMVVRSEMVRKIAGVVHAGTGIRTAWVAPAQTQAVPNFDANIANGGHDVRRVMIRPKLMNKVAGYFRGRGGEAHYQPQRVAHLKAGTMVRLAHHGS
jgi:transglycosylase-like protein with SLT domain